MTGKYPRGAAIVMAMGLAAFAAAIAVALQWQQQRWLRQFQYRAEQVQAQTLALAGIHWSRQILYEDRRVSQFDHLNEPWAQRLPPTPLENGDISGDILDAQGLLNVNNLAKGSEEDRAQWRRLLTRVGLPVELVDALEDWVDKDDTPSGPGGAEDSYYSQQSPPSLCANRNVVRIGELLAVRGFTPAMLEKLLPFVTALPTTEPLNVNTAPVEVLVSAIAGLPIEDATRIVAQRNIRPFQNTSAFTQQLPPAANVPAGTTLTVSSNFFLVTVQARQGTTLARARALLKRDQSGWPDIVWQTVE